MKGCICYRMRKNSKTDIDTRTWRRRRLCFESSRLEARADRSVKPEPHCSLIKANVHTHKMSLPLGNEVFEVHAFSFAENVDDVPPQDSRLSRHHGFWK